MGAATDPSRLVDDARAVRGVVAAAVVGVDGEVVAAAGEGAALLERMQRTATNALAAAEAFASLLDAVEDDGFGPEGGREADGDDGGAVGEEEGARAATPSGQGATHLTVLYQDVNPLLFEPLPGGDRLLVLAVESAADIGRARFHLKRLRAG
ncbi:MAG TPA: hypothetical protein VFF08_05870 [Trueperaceae bacterium]|nr:hypothetical protein [Trueperaceae bacterium]